MPEVFADTGYWIALINGRDQGHKKAIEVRTSLAEYRIITTEMVLIELLNYASRRGERMRDLAARTATGLTHDNNTTVIPQTSSQFHTALASYMRRPDQNWSIVDCASFIVMEERGIQEALAFDRHFQQAGFTALLRDSE